MSAYETEVQKAVYDRFTGDAQLMSLVKKIYDHVRQADEPEKNDEFPYISIGEASYIPFDTDNSVGAEGTLHIHVWSRYRGTALIKEIQARVYALLHRYDLPIADNWLVGIEWEWSETVRDPDNFTRQGIQRFRVTVESTE